MYLPLGILILCLIASFCLYFKRREDRNFFKWLSVLFIFILIACVLYLVKQPEIAAGIIGAMGAVLTSSYFTLSEDLKKHKALYSLTEKHKYYQQLMENLYAIYVKEQKIITSLNKEEDLEEKIANIQKIQTYINPQNIYFSQAIISRWREFEANVSLFVSILKLQEAKGREDLRNMLWANLSKQKNGMDEILGAIKEELEIKNYTSPKFPVISKLREKIPLNLSSGKENKKI